MKIAIIGSHGYIGSFLYSQLRSNSKGIQLTGFTKTDRGLNQPNCHFITGKEIDGALLRSFDVIIYAAGICGFDTCATHSEMDLIKENVDDIFTLARSLVSSKTRLIYLSTAVLYEGAEQSEREGKETDVLDCEGMSPYERSYYKREQLLSTLRPNLDCISLRLGTVIAVSPMQNLTRVHIAMLRAAILRGEISVTNGQCSRPILAGSDLVATVQMLLTHPNPAPCYNVHSFNISIHQVAQAMCERLGVPIVEKQSLGQGHSFQASNSLLQKTLSRDHVFVTNHELITMLIANVNYLCLDSLRVRHHGTCRVCGETNIMPVLNLGKQPLANDFRPPNYQQHQPLATYPLLLERCRGCNHTQLGYVVPPSAMFSHYLYASGTSETIRSYFQWLADKCIIESGGKTTGTVLEIASNDGTQLDFFRRRGWKTFGVDPAANFAKEAIAKGHKIRVGFWGVDSSVTDTDGLVPDVILAQNVFAHVPRPAPFLEACRRVMKPHTKLYIQTSQCNMYLNGEFDTIYHEHISFFTASSFKKCADSAGLRIVHLETTAIHGTSFLVCFQLATTGSTHQHHSSLQERIEFERRSGMDEDFFWIRFRTKAEQLCHWIGDNFFNLQSVGAGGWKLCAYGAAAKGMTLLNYVNRSGLEFIVDDSPLKQGLLAPFMNVPIHLPRHLDQPGKLAILILCWNFLEEILEKIALFRTTRLLDTLVIVPFPHPRILKWSGTVFTDFRKLNTQE